MFKHARLVVAALAMLCLSQAAKAELKVGDEAPALTTGKFVKGEKVEKLEKGKFYVVEFWATWCGPCRQTIPHLTEMQKANKDVIFIGQNVWEEKQEDVAPFVEKMGDKMDYRVALDTEAGDKGKMANDWMKAAGQDGIPTAFIIDKETKIAWIGHPMEMGEILPQVLAGTFDSKKYAEAQKAKNDAGEKLQAALEGKKWDEALGLIDGMVKENPDLKAQLTGLKLQITLEKGDWKAAAAMSDDAIKAIGNESGPLNEIAWSICENESKDKDLDLALKFANAANDLEKGGNAGVLDTLARVYFEQKNLDKAVETQKLAVDKSKDAKDMDEDGKKELAQTLKKYEDANAGK